MHHTRGLPGRAWPNPRCVVTSSKLKFDLGVRLCSVPIFCAILCVLVNVGRWSGVVANRAVYGLSFSATREGTERRIGKNSGLEWTDVNPLRLFFHTNRKSGWKSGNPSRSATRIVNPVHLSAGGLTKLQSRCGIAVIHR